MNKGTILLILMILGCSFLFWVLLDVLNYIIRHKYKRFFLNLIYIMEAQFNLKHRKQLFSAQWELKKLQIASEVQKIKAAEAEKETLHQVEDVATIPGDIRKLEWQVKNSEGNNSNYITIDITPKTLQIEK